MVLPADFKRAMAALPAGVAVVTAATRDGGWCGATLSAFMSLSLDPPLVAMAMAETSRTAAAIEAAGAFAAHIVGARQEAAAMRFASSGTDKFAGLTTEVNDRGTPVIQDFDVAVECVLEAAYPGGDHRIFVGRVEAVRIAGVVQPTIWFERGFHPVPMQLQGA
ncbi:flavin reductase family protein [Phenylobacterium immobile]|uniref:flavin reductase family protein n=1 Tax=Phenylobacterium immobile TaxID=21 RepID=UPI000AFCF2E9|nr:flavin reductase family protein [Phenylobacterium immobile]